MNTNTQNINIDMLNPDMSEPRTKLITLIVKRRPLSRKRKTRLGLPMRRLQGNPPTENMCIETIKRTFIKADTVVAGF